MIQTLIKTKRAETKVSQTELARAAGWNQATICRIEADAHAAPIENFERMAAVMAAVGLRVQIVDAAGCVVWEAKQNG